MLWVHSGPPRCQLCECLDCGDVEPERTCVACRSRAPQSDLLRLVSAGGALVADPDRRLPGRGCYLHQSCLPSATPRVLSRGLRSSLDPAQVATVLGALSAD